MLVGALLVIRAIADAAYVYVPQYRFRNDFRLLYGAVVTTFHDGYSHLYDPIAQKAAVEGLGPGFYWSLFLNPPPLVWLATPFAGGRHEARVQKITRIEQKYSRERT